MTRERRMPTRAELARITSGRPVVRKTLPPNKSQPGGQPDLRGGQDAGRVFGSFYTQRDHGGTRWRTDPKQ